MLPTLRRQLRRRKAATALWAVAAMAAVLLYLWWVMQKDGADLAHNQWLLLASGGAMALFLIILFSVYALADGTRRVLGVFSPMELAACEECIQGVNLYRQIITVTPQIVFINANGYTIRLVPTAGMGRVQRITGSYKGKPTYSLQLYDKAGKVICRGIRCRDLVQAQQIQAELERVAPQRQDRTDAIYIAAFEELEPGYEEVYQPLLVLTANGRDELVLARLVGPDEGQTLQEAASDVSRFVQKQAAQSVLAYRRYDGGNEREQQALDRLTGQIDAILRRQTIS